MTKKHSVKTAKSSWDTSEKITFMYCGTEEANPIEWLQFMAHQFSELANSWDGYDSDCLESYFKEYDCLDISKANDLSTVGTDMSPWEIYVESSELLAYEIERNRENLIKAFANKVIFPNLLNVIGIIDSVISEAKEYEFMFHYCLCFSVASSPEEARERFGEFAVPVYKKKPILTKDDYERAFVRAVELLEIIKKKQFSAKLRESAWAIKGYCTLNAESPEQYAKIEAEITKRKWNLNLANEAIRPIIKKHCKTNPLLLTARFIQKKTGCPKSTVVKTENWKLLEGIKSKYKDSQGEKPHKDGYLSDKMLSIAEETEDGTVKLHKSHKKKNIEGDE